MSILGANTAYQFHYWMDTLALSSSLAVYWYLVNESFQQGDALEMTHRKMKSVHLDEDLTFRNALLRFWEMIFAMLLLRSQLICLKQLHPKSAERSCRVFHSD